MSTNPYESPQPLESVAPPTMSEVVGVPFESAHARSISARAMMSLVLALELMSMVSLWMQIRLLQAARVGQVTQEQLESNDFRQQMLGFAALALAIPNVVCFLMWFHRAYRNLPALGAAGLNYTPRWAVGSWFVPFLNLVRPCQIANEIWRASDPRISEPWGAAWRRAKLTPLIGLWWATWIITNIASNIASRLPADDIDQLTSTSWCWIAAGVPRLISAALAIWLITAIDRRQEQKYERRFQQGQPVAVEMTPA
ncbi:MAG: DUF4328 domain-containing protein [Pirellulales bacterium]